MASLEESIILYSSRVKMLESFTTGKNRIYALEQTKDILELLNELKRYRDKDKEIQNLTHGVRSHSVVNSVGITSVTCTCGEITNYKVPLQSLSDFECPKRKR